MKLMNNGTRSFLLSLGVVIKHQAQGDRNKLLADHGKVSFDPKMIMELTDEAGEKLLRSYGKEEFVVIEAAKPKVEKIEEKVEEIVEAAAEVIKIEEAVEAPKKAGRPRKV